MRKFSFGPTFSMRGRKFKGLRGWSGKPTHPPLTDIPIAAFIFVAVFDLLSAIGGDSHAWPREIYHAGTWLMIGGLAVTVLAMLTGLIDRNTSSEAGTQARRTINAHAITMVVMAIVAIVDLIWRLASHDEASAPVGLVILSIIVALLVAAGSSLGGTMVFDYGFNVETAGDSPVWHQSETDVYHGDK